MIQTTPSLTSTFALSKQNKSPRDYFQFMQTEFQSFFVFDVSIHSNVETLNSTSEAEISFARLDKPDNKKTHRWNVNI